MEEVFSLRKPLIIANWKMNKNLESARNFCRRFLPLVDDCQKVDIAICPPFTCLLPVMEEIEKSSIFLGAQNMFWEKDGAYTGEVSAEMLIDVGCTCVIIGHSERRHILGEDNKGVNRKVIKALETGLTPVICVGETLQERKNNLALEIVKKQLQAALEGVKTEQNEIVIAYEPVWAIGTGVNASAGDAQEMCCFIRKCLNQILGEQADAIRILYGGSVKESNIQEFMAEDDIDGALIGGASLEAESFAGIVRLVNNG